MYSGSAQGLVERVINVRDYYYYYNNYVVSIYPSSSARKPKQATLESHAHLQPARARGGLWLVNIVIENSQREAQNRFDRVQHMAVTEKATETRQISPEKSAFTLQVTKHSRYENRR